MVHPFLHSEQCPYIRYSIWQRCIAMKNIALSKSIYMSCKGQYPYQIQHYTCRYHCTELCPNSRNSDVYKTFTYQNQCKGKTVQHTIYHSREGERWEAVEMKQCTHFSRNWHQWYSERSVWYCHNSSHKPARWHSRADGAIQ